MDPVTHPRASKETLLFTASTVLLLAGGLAWLLSAQTPARVLWILGTVLGLGFSVVWTVDAIRRRQLSVDIIAVLALAGALAVNEPFAGAMITVMLASGQLLEARAAARARRELSLLVERAPRTARRLVEGGVVEIPVDDVVVGDLLLVGTGEIVPVDGRLRSIAVQAQASSAPFVRAADRFAVLFVPLTLILAGASWVLSGDAVRAVAAEHPGCLLYTS